MADPPGLGTARLLFAQLRFEMMAPPIVAVLRSLELDRSDLLGIEPVGGGCINRAARLRFSGGRFFLKWNPEAESNFFALEAEGLRSLAATRAMRFPEVIDRSRQGERPAWLLLEWIDEGTPTSRSWSVLGRELARLHRHRARPPEGSGADDGSSYGWPRDNVIGCLPQPNGPLDDWGEFWARRRILPLARELRAREKLSAPEFGALERAAELSRALLTAATEKDGPSLLHGDLWSGNVVFDRSGAPVLVDPAVYFGHREVDLAMCRLFGGFPPDFFRTYQETWPLGPGWRRRLRAYQLYPLLVHARLFGGGYLARALESAAAWNLG